ncbi:MAG: 3'-phosphoadenosine 5'-phosphate phosphatase [Acidimicrobiales bacterium]|nr:MAG: 3'(2'),5'-bisphosphate nucleotidase CysQ [Actinomycetota bacterium]MBV6508959.1 3'-phosphoadenosine 5'-phosphate phosphatase [Acidimicrobiales bacterium]RIK08405.1 MAG: 3'(2'),5'-bisphosphate nucleotidase CysQ [Acidobacteriota bacterium]
MADRRDHHEAARIAEAAGRQLLRLRAELADRDVNPRELKDRGDRLSHQFILEELAVAFPDDAVLSEEGADDDARLAAPRVWIVDPLDGTREFSEVPRTDWAIHVALVQSGSPTAGAVSLPAIGVTYATDPAPPQPPRPPQRLRVVVSRTRPPAEAIRIAEALDAELVEMGSAGAKAMSILRGDADIYPHSGGQYEWDSAAPVAVAAAAGLHVSRIDGSDLVYNRPDPYLPDLLICRPEHAEQVIEAARA